MEIYEVIFFLNKGGKPKWPTSKKLIYKGREIYRGGNKQTFPKVKKNKN
jgi:hypothetical protein